MPGESIEPLSDCVECRHRSPAAVGVNTVDGWRWWCLAHLADAEDAINTLHMIHALWDNPDA